MKDHSSRDARSSILTIQFLVAVFTRSNAHVGDILRIGNVSRREQAEFRQRIEAGSPTFFDGREFKAQMSLLCTEASGLFLFPSRKRHTSCLSDWSSDVCSSD